MISDADSRALGQWTYLVTPKLQAMDPEQHPWGRADFDGFVHVLSSFSCLSVISSMICRWVGTWMRSDGITGDCRGVYGLPPSDHHHAWMKPANDDSMTIQAATRKMRAAW